MLPELRALPAVSWPDVHGTRHTANGIQASLPRIALLQGWRRGAWHGQDLPPAHGLDHVLVSPAAACVASGSLTVL